MLLPMKAYTDAHASHGTTEPLPEIEETSFGEISLADGLQKSRHLVRCGHFE